MYVTLVQNISASTQSVSSLCDSLKHLNPHQINPFLSQNLAITCYSTLYEKWTLFICIYLYEINTGPATYLIGACWRWTLIAMLSHTRIYPTYHKNLFNIHIKKFSSFTLNKNKTTLTIKGLGTWWKTFTDSVGVRIDKRRNTGWAFAHWSNSRLYIRPSVNCPFTEVRTFLYIEAHRHSAL